MHSAILLLSLLSVFHGLAAAAAIASEHPTNVNLPKASRSKLPSPCPVLDNPAGNLVLSASFSEENGGQSPAVYEPVAGVHCGGRYCDDKRLVSIADRLTLSLRGDVHYTGYFSEEGVNQAYCPDDMLMVRIQCQGRYCDRIRLGCRRYTQSYERVQDDVKVVPFFSEEQGSGTCLPGYYVFGMECSGRYCDNISLYCVRFICKE